MTPHELAALIGTVATDVLAAHDLDTSVLPETIVVERPRHADHGDYATTLALQVAKKLGVNPRELAGWLAAGLEDTAAISAAEVAGPGFINLRLDTGSQGKLVGEILAAGTRYGRSETLSGQHINLEFVSANPTGPLHLGGARWAAVGSALGSILASQGAQVTREYYFNDHGAQIDRFARSVDAAAHGLPTPEDGYGGDYIADVAAQVTAAVPGILDLDDAARLETFRAHGVELMFAHVKRTLTEFGTEFDVFFHENSLFESGAVDAVIAKLKDNGNLYFQDGAWWLKSSDFGDDKDRVVIKSDGDAAYIAGDIAYIEDKLARGADRAIYMLGADHHGYIQRLKAAAQALGHDAAVVEVLIGQMVNLVRDGQPVKMSKRAGTIITLDDLVEAVGVDAGRYAMLRNSVDSTLDIDLEKWASRTSDNPVFYVQYGHARLCSIARKAADLGITTTGAEIDFALLSHEREGELIRTLGDYPTVLATAAELREPHRVARYAEDLAGTFHRFYDACQILPKGEETVAELHRSRLALAMATRQVLANALDVIGISAPERM